MIIRDFQIPDLDQVLELANNYNLSIPNDAKILVGQDSNNEIKAVVGLRNILNISPFISKNPIIGKKLFDYVDNLIKANNYPLVQCVTNPQNKKLFEKLGFKEIFHDKIIMEKIIQ